MVKSFQITNFLQNIKTKAIKPKVYALVLRNSLNEFLYQGIHYSLEEALQRAREIAKERTSLLGGSFLDWNMVLWNMLDLEQIQNEVIEDNTQNFKDYLDKTIEGLDKDFDKNELMTKILETKDKKLFKEKIKLFDKNEIKMLEKGLKEK